MIGAVIGAAAGYFLTKRPVVGAVLGGVAGYYLGTKLASQPPSRITLAQRPTSGAQAHMAMTREDNTDKIAAMREASRVPSTPVNMMDVMRESGRIPGDMSPTMAVSRSWTALVDDLAETYSLNANRRENLLHSGGFSGTFPTRAQAERTAQYLATQQ